VEEAKEDCVSVGTTFLCINRQQPNYKEEEEGDFWDEVGRAK
jgi:hypothetical protein